MLTRRGKASVTAFFILLAAGRVLGVTELFGIGVAVLALVAAGVVRLRASQARVAVSARVSPEAIEATQAAELELFVENTGAGPTPASRLQLVPSGGGRHRILIPRLAPGERATVAIGLDTSRRGRRQIGGYDVVLTDGLGLASQRLVSTGSIAYLVRPCTEELPHTLPFSVGPGGRESTHSAAERIVTGAAMLRGYVPGDDGRRIHWPTTARVGEIMVREGGDPDSANRSGTTIVLGTNRGGGDGFERAVEIVASLAATALREGMLRVVTTGGYESGLASGPAHLDGIGLHLATVQPREARLPSQVLAADEATAEAAAPERSHPAGPEALVGRLLGHGSVRDGWNVLVTVEAVSRLEDAELSPDVLAPVSSQVGAVVLVLVGGEVARFERLTRSEIAVFLPVGTALHGIWNTALDLPIGQERAVDGGQEEIAHPQAGHLAAT